MSQLFIVNENDFTQFIEVPSYKVNENDIKEDCDIDIIFNESYDITIKSDFELVKVDDFGIYILPNDDFSFEIDNKVQSFYRLSALTECFYNDFSTLFLSS